MGHPRVSSRARAPRVCASAAFGDLRTGTATRQRRHRQTAMSSVEPGEICAGAYDARGASLAVWRLSTVRMRALPPETATAKRQNQNKKCSSRREAPPTRSRVYHVRPAARRHLEAARDRARKPKSQKKKK